MEKLLHFFRRWETSRYIHLKCILYIVYTCVCTKEVMREIWNCSYKNECSSKRTCLYSGSYITIGTGYTVWPLIITPSIHRWLLLILEWEIPWGCGTLSSDECLRNTQDYVHYDLLTRMQPSSKMCRIMEELSNLRRRVFDKLWFQTFQKNISLIWHVWTWKFIDYDQWK